MLIGELEEESRQKITELEALCKRLREDAQKLKEEKITLEGMIHSHDELFIEMAKEDGLNCMGENGDDKGNATAPPAPVPPTAVPEEIDEEEAPICQYSFTPATILLGILYLINTHTSVGQHKEPCHCQQC
jgi:hypothetical protein